MAGGWLSLCVLVALSVFLTPGYCTFQPIDLQSSDVQCNMSSIYDHFIWGRSVGCNGAINENTDTVWKNTSDDNPNCVYTVDGTNEYWLLNLGKQYNIHRVTIYPEKSGDYMRDISVLVDDTEIFRFPLDRQITYTLRITGGQLPRRGRFIRLRRYSAFVTFCELQVDECTTDSYGVDCEETCSPGCRANGDSATCDSISGNCTRGCQINWWGGRCDKRCPSHCAVQCDRELGCTECQDNFAPSDCQECKPGWYGVRCDAPCSVHCKPEVDGDIRCQQNDGACNSGCVSGWYRLNCTIPCSPSCDGGCQDDDGVCNGCKTGSFGPRCELSCGKGCVDNICNKQDGTCNCSTGWSPPSCRECVSGYYGEGSCTECSSHCLGDDVCNNDNGRCPRGCDNGFDGDRCDRCNRTGWGSDCSLPCGRCAGDGSCYALTGHCVGGCVEGFGGDNCTLKLASGENDDGNLAGPIVGGLLGAGALIGTAVLLAAFVNRRRRSRDAANTADTDGVHFSSGNAPIGDVTEGDKPETETPGNESNYAQLEKYENPDDIRPYSVLQDGGKLPKYLNIQSDQETALYQNTTVSKN